MQRIAQRRHRHPPRLSIVRACSMMIDGHCHYSPSGVLGILERKRLIYRIHCRIILHRTLMNVITINPSTIGGDSPQKSINSPTYHGGGPTKERRRPWQRRWRFHIIMWTGTAGAIAASGCTQLQRARGANRQLFPSHTKSYTATTTTTPVGETVVLRRENTAAARNEHGGHYLRFGRRARAV